jgi:hypothetical protein
MWLRAVAIAAPLLFVAWLIVVLQDWSKSTPSGRLVGLVFLVTMACAGLWGIRTLVGS